jgi:shikimate kinase
MFFLVIPNILIRILFYMCSDKLIEESAGGTPVAQIFKEKNEEYFRDSEVMAISLDHILL